jgi:hypothetical protein
MQILHLLTILFLDAHVASHATQQSLNTRKYVKAIVSAAATSISATGSQSAARVTPDTFEVYDA